MKTNVHPTFNEEAQVVCVCGNRFSVGSTKDTIHVELCYKCHPFYTGEQRFTDTRSAIKNFQKKVEAAQHYKSNQQNKKEEQKKKDEGPKSLRDMLMGLK
jgi:large subunit ribosomal protein L31